MGICHRAGQGRFGDDGQTTAHVDIGAGQWAIHDTQNVIRRKGFNGRAIFKDIFHTQPTGANVLLGILFLNTLIVNITGVEIDPGDSVGKTTNHHICPPSRGTL